MYHLMEVLSTHCEHWYDIHLCLPQHVLRELHPCKIFLTFDDVCT
jgi:hypothetical protein